MQSFKTHLDQPLNNHRPGIFQASLRYDLNSSEWIKVYLDVNQKDEIKNFSYEAKGMRGFIPYFSALSLLIQNLTVTEALELSHEDFYDFFDGDDLFHELLSTGHIPLIQLPLILLRDAIFQFTGEENILEHRANELICRCFGVYESDLKKLIASERSFELVDVIKKTHVSAGCGSCRGDVEEIYHEVRFTHPTVMSLNTLTPTGKIGDLTTAQWVMKLDKAIENFKGQNALLDLDVEIVKFKYPELRLKIHTAPEKLDPDKLKEKLEYFLTQSVQIKIEIKYKD